MGQSRRSENPPLYIYQYQFIDDLSFVRTPVQVFPSETPEELRRVTQTIRSQLLEAGWEGDGELGVLWLAPFVDVGIEDTNGTYVWHVKQANNGVSWLASEHGGARGLR